jgi:hypothetical protein
MPVLNPLAVFAKPGVFVSAEPQTRKHQANKAEKNDSENDGSGLAHVPLIGVR